MTAYKTKYDFNNILSQFVLKGKLVSDMEANYGKMKQIINEY